MCDFKPGDEVVCVDARSRGLPADNLVEGRVYTVRDAWGSSVLLYEVSPIEPRSPGFRADRFRKVQRRDLSAWLKTSVGNTDKLDKRQTKKVPA